MQSLFSCSFIRKFIQIRSIDIPQVSEPQSSESMIFHRFRYNLEGHTCNYKPCSVVHSYTRSSSSEALIFLRFWSFRARNQCFSIGFGTIWKVTPATCKPCFSCSFVRTLIQLQIIRNSLGIPQESFWNSGFQMFQESLQFNRICYDSTSAMAVFHCRMQFRPEPLINT